MATIIRPIYRLIDADSPDGKVIDPDLDLRDFVALNDLHEEEDAMYTALSCGMPYYVGGGAAPLFMIRRDRST
jgi:hypothetical protein